MLGITAHLERDLPALYARAPIVIVALAKAPIITLFLALAHGMHLTSSSRASARDEHGSLAPLC